MASRTMTPPGTERRFPKAADEIGAIARGVAEGWNDIEMYRITVRQIQRVFHSGTATDRETMLDQRPATTGTVWDSVLAATVEHVALIHGYEPPEWVNEPERFSAQPQVLLKEYSEPRTAFQPGPFARHGVVIDVRDLDWRTGDGRQWTVEPQPVDETLRRA